MNDYVIVANGGFLVRAIIFEATLNKTIIALDGAANKLKRIDIKPDIILGDFDSIDAETQAYWGIQRTFNDITKDDEPYLGHHGVTIVPAKDQDDTDLVKAIRYCDKQGALSITILCAMGKREDHSEGVKMALRTEYRRDRVITLHTEQQSLRCAQDETIIITGEPGDQCGFIATHTGSFCSEGLMYECVEHSESICNLLRSTHASICVKGFGLLIMPPELPSQRAYMCKTEEEQLELQLRDAKPKRSTEQLAMFGLFAAGVVGVVAMAASSNMGMSPK